MKRTEPIGHQGWRQLKRGGNRRPLKAKPEGDVPQPKDHGRRSALVARLTYLIIGLYALTFALLSIQQHDGFGTNAFDLGNMDQAVWNTANGRWFHFTNWQGGHSRLAAHVEPILLPISLLYMVASSPKTLLVLQSVVISLGALPAFWLARKKLANDFAAVTFASAYLLAPELEAANLADFHAVSLSAAFLLFAFYFVDQRRYVLFSVFALFAMSTKEEIPLVVLVMGLYVVFAQKKPRLGWAIAGFSFIWFIVAFFVIIPHFNPLKASPYLTRYDYMGSSPRQILFDFVFNPGKTIETLADPMKLDYLRTMLQPVLYLSLLSPTSFALAIPDLGINLLSNFQQMYSGGAHYSSAVIPAVIISAILGLANAQRFVRAFSEALAQPITYVLSGLVLILSISGYYQGVVLPLSDHFPVVTSHNRLAQEFIKRIPQDKGVSAGSTLNPHVSQRERLYLFPDGLDDADYVFLDVTASPHPKDEGSQYTEIQKLLRSGKWGVEAAKDGYLLLSREATTTQLPEEFFTFTETRKPQIDNSRKVTFGNSLRFLGYDLHPKSTKLSGRDAYAQMTLYWEVVKPLQKDLWVTVQVAASQAIIFTSAYQPTLLWHPTHEWPVGEIVPVEVLRVPLQGVPAVDVLIGVRSGADPNDASLRLRPDLSEDLAAELNGDGTMLNLLRLRAR
ncbi:MAG: DUF2079 domain-containing protein [Chloroflexi bacterium]|nr:DUF2079 domain-containing protein [Chloroflexota bacterium]